MDYWIFIATNRAGLSGRYIYTRRVADAFWGLDQRTPNRRNVHKGDAVVFYLGSPECAFVGAARVASDPYRVSRERRRQLSYGNEDIEPDYGVDLIDRENWRDPVPLPRLMGQLGFIRNRRYWGIYFQGGVRQLTEDEYALIVSTAHATAASETLPAVHHADHLSAVQVTSPPALTTDVPAARASGRKPRVFALESHLEQFILANWDSIDWGGRSLSLYGGKRSRAHQFQAGAWNIDFLAIDNRDGALVAIELKRDRAADAAVGQVLRYMGWIRDNVAKEGQDVRGIIVCREADASLRQAVGQVRNVSVLTYKVHFSLAEA